MPPPAEGGLGTSGLVAEAIYTSLHLQKPRIFQTSEQLPSCRLTWDLNTAIFRGLSFWHPLFWFLPLICRGVLHQHTPVTRHPKVKKETKILKQLLPSGALFFLFFFFGKGPLLNCHALPFPFAGWPEFWLRPGCGLHSLQLGGGVLSNVAEPAKKRMPLFSRGKSTEHRRVAWWVSLVLRQDWPGQGPGRLSCGDGSRRGTTRPPCLRLPFFFFFFSSSFLGASGHCKKEK